MPQAVPKPTTEWHKFLLPSLFAWQIQTHESKQKTFVPTKKLDAKENRRHAAVASATSTSPKTIPKITITTTRTITNKANKFKINAKSQEL